jgi:hypothetical protein
MSELSPQPDERARKNLAAIFQALSQTGQSNVAKDLGVSEPTLSRMKEKDLPETAKLLSLCKLKVVPQDFRCVSREYLSGLETFAGLWLKHVAEQNAQGGDNGLTWD